MGSPSSHETHSRSDCFSLVWVGTAGTQCEKKCAACWKNDIYTCMFGGMCVYGNRCLLEVIMFAGSLSLCTDIHINSWYSHFKDIQDRTYVYSRLCPTFLLFSVMYF